MALHRLLSRQLKKLGCDINACNDWPGFVQLVNNAYWQSDDDREVLERALRLSSGEVMQINAELRTMMQALRESEEKYRAIFNNAPVGILQSSIDGRLLDGNPALARMLGYEDRQHLLKSVANLSRDVYLHPEDRQAFLDALMASPDGMSLEMEFKRLDGSRFIAFLNASLQRDEQGLPAYINCTAKDITERKLAEMESLESAQKFSSLFDNMKEGVALHSPIRDACGEVIDYRIEAVNNSYERILGLRAEDVVGLPVTEVYDSDETLFLDKLFSVTVSGEPAQFETYFSARGIHTSISVAPLNNGGISTIFFDTTESKQLEAQLLFRALHDPLTGLANRTLCLDRIAQANERAIRREGIRFAVVFMDLDRFKMVNDSLGHEAGDLLLREIAQRLLTCTRKMDTVCRYGGDEFTIVLEELSPAEVMQTINRIRKSLMTPMIIGNQNIQIEASFGVAYGPVPDSQPEDLLRNANIALHKAKQRGRNRVVVYKPRMHRAAIQTMSLQSDMRRGVDSGEFFMVYQPIECLQTSQVEGFEALMRWAHPQRGLIRPVEFIPLAEKTGFILELGQLAVRRACEDLASLLRTMPEAERLTISVNISPRQFSRWGLAEQIEQALADNCLPASALVLEITESSIMNYPEASAGMLARLKEKGMGIAIDDFGTGYSSMSALQQLPLDRLKIDMGFVRRITESYEDREIVRAIIALARSLHLKTVAEGIETEEQRQLLKEMGCDLGQGYLFSRPVPLTEVLKIIRP